MFNISFKIIKTILIKTLQLVYILPEKLCNNSYNVIGCLLHFKIHLNGKQLNPYGITHILSAITSPH